MTDRQTTSASDIESWNADAPVPAARPLSDFCMERVGDEIVIYDSALNRYHSLNEVAFEIWRSCDGARSIEAVAAVVEKSGAEVRPATIESAVAQLGQSGLFVAPEGLFEGTTGRRTLIKIAAAGVLGGIALPYVKSITVPDAASAASAAQCVNLGYLNMTCTNNGNCQSACPPRTNGNCVQVDTSGIGCCECV